MKKLLIVIAFLGLISFAFPNEATASNDPCWTCTLYCCDGSRHIVIVCDWGSDPYAWAELLCPNCGE
jgi:hypothetical protein